MSSDLETPPLPLSCTGPGLPLQTFVICWFTFVVSLTISLLVYTGLEAKKKLEQIKTTMGCEHESDGSDCSSLPSVEVRDWSEDYVVLPEEVRSKVERRRLRFGSLGEIKEDEGEEGEEEGGGTRSPSDESITGAEAGNCREISGERGTVEKSDYRA